MSHAHSGSRKYLLYGGRNTGRQITSITVALEGFLMPASKAA